MSVRTKLIGGVICGLAALFYVYDYFVQVAPSIMVDNLMQDFHIGAGSLGLLSASFFYAYAMMQLPAGWTLDRLGARKLLSLAVLISACGVLLFSKANYFWLACLGRFLIGFGSAFAFISTLFLLSRWFSHKYFALFAGFVQLGACIGSIIGLKPVAVLVNQYGWRETMWYTGLATLGLALVFWLVIRNGPPLKQQASESQKSSSVTSLFKNKQLWVICSCGFLSWIPVAGVGALWGVPYMMKVYHLSNTAAGSLMTWFWLGIGLGSPFVGWLSLKLQLRKLPIVVCFFSAIIASIILIEAPRLSLITCVIGLCLLGFSASTQSLSFGVLKDVVPAEQFGFASGMNNMAAILGGAFAQPMIGFILRLTWNGAYAHGAPLYSLADYQASLYMLPAIALIGLFVSWLGLSETHCRRMVFSRSSAHRGSAIPEITR